MKPELKGYSLFKNAWLSTRRTLPLYEVARAAFMGERDNLKNKRAHLRQIKIIRAGTPPTIINTSFESSTPGVDKLRHISPLKAHTISTHWPNGKRRIAVNLIMYVNRINNPPP
jgi:hypothetical protein